LLCFRDCSRKGRGAQEAFSPGDKIPYGDPLAPQIGEENFQNGPDQLSGAMRRGIPEDLLDHVELAPEDQEMEIQYGFNSLADVTGR
jgi:hypothetical protein